MRVWGECKESVGRVWESVEEYGESVGRVWGECGESVGRVWGALVYIGIFLSMMILLTKSLLEMLIVVTTMSI